jgi:CHAT domain-containing protein
VPEESLELPAALLGVGYAAVLGALWPVNDISTSLLFVRCYATFGRAVGDLDAAAGLRDAQRWLSRATHRELAEFFADYLTLTGEVNRHLREAVRYEYRRHLLADLMGRRPMPTPVTGQVSPAKEPDEPSGATVAARQRLVGDAGTACCPLGCSHALTCAVEKKIYGV